MRYRTDIDKRYMNWIIDFFEADILAMTDDNFDKRSSVTNQGGRPYLYSPREIGDQMVTYFRDCAENNRPFMITGFCIHVGISREGLRRLEKSSNNQFVGTIKKGKQMVEFYLAIQLYLKPNPQGIIFILKNMGWSDKEVVENKADVEITDKERIEALERINNISE